VVHVDNGQDALALVRNGGKFQVLLTDYAMPGMTGATLIRDMQRLAPSLPALMVTGYNHSAVQDEDFPTGIRVLRKPILRDDLLLQVKAAIGLGIQRQPVTDFVETASGNVVPLLPRKPA
jgi:CheY-like chemotaxis protein